MAKVPNRKVNTLQNAADAKSCSLVDSTIAIKPPIEMAEDMTITDRMAHFRSALILLTETRNAIPNAR